MEVRSASMGTMGTHKGRNSVGLVPAAAQQAGLRSASVPGLEQPQEEAGGAPQCGRKRELHRRPLGPSGINTATAPLRPRATHTALAPKTQERDCGKCYSAYSQSDTLQIHQTCFHSRGVCFHLSSP